MKLMIVDEETAARTMLIRLCDRRPDLCVVGEANCGMAAIEAAGDLSPDVVMLSMRLPDMTGYEVLKTINSRTHSVGIMTTALPEQASTALSQGALDCLVKPVSAGRFDRALARARRRIGTLHSNAPPEPTRRDLNPAARFLVGERQKRLYPLDPAAVDYIESSGNYVTLHAGRSEFISRDSIKRLSAQLADCGFVRIERSLLMNIRSVLYAEFAGHGTFSFTLTSGACLHSSATYREEILNRLPLQSVSKRDPPKIPSLPQGANN